ncbi:uncharacterized protein LOC110663680 isoform X2 [Hevea brasiliensis]|uniref:uncharacterized protein LOC110663680 isoform X2 n=1 Tax=Hevea brasiliensis TaxID=3981 RepID=UPI0025DD3E83|nr:uncharacterized protein LOC110663680 isoform X2 [Hevea brasiliensis]
MAALLFLRGIPFLRVRLGRQRLAAGTLSPLRHPWSSTADPTKVDEEVSTAGKTTAVLSARDPPNYPRWDDPDYRKWKDKEEEILRDIEAIVTLTKEILHSDRYLDGEHLTAEDEKAVVENLLTYHPNSEDKIGCGLDSIMEHKGINQECSQSNGLES